MTFAAFGVWQQRESVHIQRSSQTKPQARRRPQYGLAQCLQMERLEEDGWVAPVGEGMDAAGREEASQEEVLGSDELVAPPEVVGAAEAKVTEVGVSEAAPDREARNSARLQPRDRPWSGRGTDMAHHATQTSMQARLEYTHGSLFPYPHKLHAKRQEAERTQTLASRSRA